MVAKPRREQRSSTPLGNAPVAAGCLNYLRSTQQNAWRFGIGLRMLSDQVSGGMVSGTSAGKVLPTLARDTPRLLFCG